MIEATGAVVMGRRSYDLGDNDTGYIEEKLKVVDSPGRTDIRSRVVT